jgi:putative tricarboxylic transport membrane protein
MTTKTRMIRALTVMFLTCCAAPNVGAASFKPTAPVEVVVHGGPGSGADLFARAIASISEKEKLQDQRMVVVNKTGGGGLVAMSYMKEKAGELNTIAMYTSVWVAAPLTSTAGKVTLKDLTPIAGLVREPSVAAVKANSPYKSMKDFIEAAKKAPGQLRQSGGSLTSVDNLTRLLIQKRTGANWAFISFPSGGERLTNLLGEHVQIMFMQPQEAAEHIRGGSLRVIAAITEKRLAALPSVPTLAEQGIDIAIPQQVRGVVAPPGVSPEVVAYWDDFFVRLTKTAAWRAYLQENQLEPGYIRSTELGKFFDDDTNQVRTLLKEAGAKVVR